MAGVGKDRTQEHWQMLSKTLVVTAGVFEATLPKVKFANFTDTESEVKNRFERLSLNNDFWNLIV